MENRWYSFAVLIQISFELLETFPSRTPADPDSGTKVSLQTFTSFESVISVIRVGTKLIGFRAMRVKTSGVILVEVADPAFQEVGERMAAM